MCSAATEPVRLGVIGTGFISAVHRQCAVRSPRVDLVAVASARGRATREPVGGLDTGVRLLTIAELLAADDVEAVLVCTRTRDHADHAVAGAREWEAPADREARGDRPGRPPPDRDRGGGASPGRSCASPITAATTRPSARSPRPVRVGSDRHAVRGPAHQPRGLPAERRQRAPPAGSSWTWACTTSTRPAGSCRRIPTPPTPSPRTPSTATPDLDNAHITVAHGGGVATIHLSRTSTLGMEIRCEVIGPDGSVVLAQAATGDGVTVRSPAANPGFPADCRDRFAAAYQAQIDDFGAACHGEQTAQRDPGGRSLGGGDGGGRARQRRAPRAPPGRRRWEWEQRAPGAGDPSASGLQPQRAVGRLLWNVPSDRGGHR